VLGVAIRQVEGVHVEAMRLRMALRMVATEVTTLLVLVMAAEAEDKGMVGVEMEEMAALLVVVVEQAHDP
tara:strand:- start:207 stop:416 length:210 start_codon:yes stop_codon:yes gene_type:complete